MRAYRDDNVSHPGPYCRWYFSAPMIGDLIKTPGSALGPNRRRRKSFFSRWGVKWGLIGTGVIALTATIALYSVRAHYQKKALSFDLTSLSQLEQSSLIYDRNGEEIG